MSRKRSILLGVLFILGFAALFIYSQVQIAITSIKLDLGWIGESIYEARQKLGRWPAELADLEGTKLTRDVPRVKAMIADGHYVVFWPREMDANGAANAERILAYDNHSRLSIFGKVWVCRGDLKVEYVSRERVEEAAERKND